MTQAVIQSLKKDRSFVSHFNNSRLTKELKLSMELRYLAEIMFGNDRLKNCTEESLAAAMCSSVHMGLSLNPALGHAYVIPYGRTATFVPSYRGMMHRVMDTGAVKVIRAELIRTGDTYKRWTDERGPHMEHVHSRIRGDVTGAYCQLVLQNGEWLIEDMDIDELERCHAAATRKNGGKETPAWKFWKGEMYRKCVVRRALKYAPANPALGELLREIDEHEPMDFGTVEDAGDGVCLSENQLNSIHAMLTEECGLDPAMAEKWMQRIAEMKGCAAPKYIPASRFEEVKTDLRERHKVIKSRREGK